MTQWRMLDGTVVEVEDGAVDDCYHMFVKREPLNMLVCNWCKTIQLSDGTKVSPSSSDKSTSAENKAEDSKEKKGDKTNEEETLRIDLNNFIGFGS